MWWIYLAGFFATALKLYKDKDYDTFQYILCCMFWPLYWLTIIREGK